MNTPSTPKEIITTVHGCPVNLDKLTDAIVQQNYTLVPTNESANAADGRGFVLLRMGQKKELLVKVKFYSKTLDKKWWQFFTKDEYERYVGALEITLGDTSHVELYRGVIPEQSQVKLDAMLWHLTKQNYAAKSEKFKAAVEYAQKKL